MKVDFWQLSRDPPERVVALIASRICADNKRLLIVSYDADQRAAIGAGLWEHSPEEFLANGQAGEPHADRQPILISGNCEALNNADQVIFADGRWRDEAAGFARSFLLFGDSAIEDARACWRSLDGKDDHERSFYRQDQGKWTKVA
ncbi:MAG: DNA polymerase III subunit chi [Pontixanthobacter sp.]